MRRLPPQIKVLGGIFSLVALAVLAITLAVASAHRTRGPRLATPPRGALPSPTATPSVVPGPLDGLPTPRRLALRRPIAVMIDNFDPDARPQSGLSQASVVFEAPAEGGITRLMAVYLEHAAPVVGPIRSARPYFVEWAAGFRPLFVHAGGAPAALQLLYQTPQVANVEALLPGPQFYRTADRVAPHNLYTSTVGVRDVAVQDGWNEPGHFAWLLHKRDAPAARRGTSEIIHVDFSTPSIGSPAAYAVTYRYDRATNGYLRYVGGSASLDRTTGRQIEAKNVVVLYATMAPISGDPELRISVAATGSGRAAFYRDGHRVWGRWSKRSVVDALRFWDNRGHEMAFDPGQIWIEVAPAGVSGSGRQP